jgi:hypothetical protein
MQNFKSARPMGSYTLKLPIDIVDKIEDEIVSYWRAGEDVLLQLSSNKRYEGPQIGAAVRLENRLQREKGELLPARVINMTSCPDFASAALLDREGVEWIYCYAVWPDLMVLATICGQPQAVNTQGRWAFDAIEGLQRG